MRRSKSKVSLDWERVRGWPPTCATAAASTASTTGTNRTVVQRQRYLEQYVRGGVCVCVSVRLRVCVCLFVGMCVFFFVGGVHVKAFSIIYFLLVLY